MSIERIKAATLEESVRAHIAQMNLVIHKDVKLARNLRFRSPAFLGEGVTAFRLQIDAYSYIERNSVAMATTIGRYCSIGHGADLAMGKHDYTHPTTSPAFYFNVFFMGHSGKIPEQHPLVLANSGISNQVHIGHDVWIGAHVRIPASVTIGHGAVIGTNTVVTKDVPPYAIVVGGGEHSSQRILKYRFPDEVISDLLEINWWDYDIPKMLTAGIKVPRDNVKDFIAFFKNEDRDRLIPISEPWRLLCTASESKVFIFPSEPDTFMDFNAVEIDDATGNAIRLFVTDMEL